MEQGACRSGVLKWRSVAAGLPPGESGAVRGARPLVRGGHVVGRAGGCGRPLSRPNGLGHPSCRRYGRGGCRRVLGPRHDTGRLSHAADVVVVHWLTRPCIAYLLLG